VSPGEAYSSARGVVSSRFFLVNFLPTAAAAGFLLLLLWAGAPGPLSFQSAWRTASGLGAADVLLIGLAVLLVAVVLAPFQLALVRLLEGGWPAWWGAGFGRLWQRRRRDALGADARVGREASGSAVSDAEIQRAGVASSRLRERFPARDHLLRPTALGNVLVAMEDRAGRRYGLDAVVVWPRLYSVLDDPVRRVVDDRRNLLDATARTSATAALATVASALLLARSGTWLLLVALPATTAIVAYQAAVQAALAYARSVETSFDLCRFNLYRALHLPFPDDGNIEHATNEALCDSWRQEIPVHLTYQHTYDQADPVGDPHGR
jgi:hypothetical protein